MLDYRKSLVCSNERKRKVDKELGSGAIKKMGKKTAKQSTFKKDLVLRKKNQEENDEMETEVYLSEGKTKKEISKYAANETIIESNAIKNNGNDSDNYIIIDKDKIIRNVNRLVKIQGRLVLEGKGTEKKSLEQIEKVNRFASSHRGNIIITAKLNPRKCSTKGGRNFLRIIDKVMETKVRPIKVVKSGFNAVDLYYDNILNANKCLDFYKGIPRDEQDIWFDIIERIVRRKGVISDWDMSLQRFGEALDDKNKIICAENIRKRVYNNELQVYEWKDTRNIVVTFEDNKLPEQLSIYEGLTNIRVRPYIPTVKQCYKCYKYGLSNFAGKSITYVPRQHKYVL
ncbi:uncharacterized protein LOC115245644 isoform X1 [Formica exsecta]|uniref:uncharacterized protein LOC115245644 isoform X1 n=1 Tax=Formica exsecta TaxID=72781 RepID=UPI0011412FF5|nr:uncharacterized protein LOC115245644 isoform X1 [Formica exsecta]